MTMSLLPKSVTMPIATVVAQGHGGTVAVTVAAVVVTGMLGNLCAPLLVKLFRVKDPMAVGLGIGACSHAMGTAKALELGETEAAWPSACAASSPRCWPCWRISLLYNGMFPGAAARRETGGFLC